MAKFRAKHNYSASQPSKSSVESTYGKGNAGFIIVAKDEKEAKEILKKKHNLNPFYVKLTKESKNMKIKKEELAEIIMETIYEMLQDGDEGLIGLMRESERMNGDVESDINEWLEKTTAIIEESLGIEPESEESDILTEERQRLLHLADIPERDTFLDSLDEAQGHPGKAKVGDKVDVGRPGKPNVGTITNVDSKGVMVKLNHKKGQYGNSGGMVGPIRAKYLVWVPAENRWFDEG